LLLLLIMTPSNTDWFESDELSLLSVPVTVNDSAKKCVCIRSVKIKLPNIKIKFSGHV